MDYKSRIKEKSVTFGKSVGKSRGLLSIYIAEERPRGFHACSRLLSDPEILVCVMPFNAKIPEMKKLLPTKIDAVKYIKENVIEEYDVVDLETINGVPPGYAMSSRGLMGFKRVKLSDDEFREIASEIHKAAQKRYIEITIAQGSD
jgi:hypothetical protein